MIRAWYQVIHLSPVRNRLMQGLTGPSAVEESRIWIGVYIQVNPMSRLRMKEGPIAQSKTFTIKRNSLQPVTMAGAGHPARQRPTTIILFALQMYCYGRQSV